MIYQFNRVYNNGVTRSNSFFGILQKDLTVTPQSWYKNSQPVNVHSTMFDEVWMTPYYPQKIVTELKKRISNKPYKQSAMHLLYKKLKAIVYKNWQPERFHVISHSSGIDSRILSYIIKELAEEHGDQWLGKVLFVENGGESKYFLKIMKAEGWDESQYFIYGDYFSGISFDRMVDKFNGISGFPVNQFYDSFYELKRQRIIPDDAQYFSGYGQYIEQAFKYRSIDYFFRKDYYYQMQMFNLFGDWIFPYWDIDYIIELSKHFEVYKSNRLRISELINRDCLPKNIANIHRYSTQEIISYGYRQMTTALLSIIQKEYDKSWYGKHRPLKMNKNIEYSNAWGAYNEAAICEHLINNGYNLKWQK